ncbi:MAG: hypothetical protein JSR82_05665 [Verrucomicrobia bacterium]|nr:hypothetical protein [Verrucomicrobiota bacterium]
MSVLPPLFTQRTGLYTPREAAFYARLHPSVLNRWLYGNKSGSRVLHPQLTGTGEKVVTFLDFVQALAVRAIRQQHRIALDKIRQAIERAEAEFGLNYPLARLHTTYLLDRDIQIVPQIGGHPVQVTGLARGQMSLRPIVEVHLRDLGWNAEGMAASYRAFAWSDREIRMDPARHFGEPVVANCDYGARALWEAAETEGSIEAAAEAYGVQPADVEIACRYYDHLGLALAA